MTKDEALKMALEALEKSRPINQSSTIPHNKHVAAITAIKEALAEQPAQQQELKHEEHGHECSPEEFLLRGILASELKCWHRLTADEAQNLVAFVQNMPAKPAQQEPFGYFRYDLRLDAWVQNREGRPGTPFYTSSPASKPWVGLTNQELIDLTAIYSGAPLYCAIEAKLKEKNG